MSTSHKTTSTLRSPLGKVRGLGAARSGVHHWWMQRVSGAALIPLTGFFLYNLDKLIHPNYSEIVISFIANPPVTIAFAAFIICAFYHARLGLEVIIEDYVHSHSLKTLLLIVNTWFFALLGLSALYLLILICAPSAEWAMRNSG